MLPFWSRMLPASTLGSLAVVGAASQAAAAVDDVAAPRDHLTERLDFWLEWTARGIEVAGVAIIVIAALVATLLFLVKAVRTREPGKAYHAYRTDLGRGILLGLELLVAADIIGTVGLDPSLDNLAVLAGIVLIRTFLSFSLEVELEGHWPWQRAYHQAERQAPADPEYRG